MSNRSFAITLVDIVIRIDGAKAVDAEFEVKNQHHWVAYQFTLPPGKHRLTAKSVKGGASMEKEFTIRGEH